MASALPLTPAPPPPPHPHPPTHPLIIVAKLIAQALDFAPDQDKCCSATTAHKPNPPSSDPSLTPTSSCHPSSPHPPFSKASASTFPPVPLLPRPLRMAFCPLARPLGGPWRRHVHRATAADASAAVLVLTAVSLYWASAAVAVAAQPPVAPQQLRCCDFGPPSSCPSPAHAPVVVARDEVHCIV